MKGYNYLKLFTIFWLRLMDERSTKSGREGVLRYGLESWTSIIYPSSSTTGLRSSLPGLRFGRGVK